jgi:hypothetical protein
MSTATSGRAREWRVRDDLIGHGFELVMRAAGSKGAADLALARDDVGLVLVQVGTVSKALGPGDRARFLRVAHLASAVPVLATVDRGRIAYREVTAGTPRHWPAWSPAIIVQD